MISFNVGNSKFNFRVSAVLIDSNNARFLTNTREGVDFFILPGGRIEMGEDSATSLKREFEEELGIEIDVVGIKATIENFFEFNNTNYHELQYIYYVKLKEQNFDLESHNDIFKGLEEHDLFKWQNVEDLDKLNYKPEQVKKIIKEVFDGDLSMKHIIIKEN